MYALSLSFNLNDFIILSSQLKRICKRPLNQWRTYFKLSDHLYDPQLIRGVRYFSFRLTTDGVGASVSTFKCSVAHKRNPRLTEQERQGNDKKMQEQRHNVLYGVIRSKHLALEQSGRQLVWIGIDPGRKGIITAANYDRRWSHSLSLVRYYQDSGFIFRLDINMAYIIQQRNHLNATGIAVQNRLADRINSSVAKDTSTYIYKFICTIEGCDGKFKSPSALNRHMKGCHEQVKTPYL